jgi:HAE1 family hydrophobic/amphiphilic exporter-1
LGISYLFGFCFGAAHESFILPLSVILSLPAGIFGAFPLLKLTGLENNIYAQVAMVMLRIVRVKCRAVVEFAIQRHAAGKSVLEAAMEEKQKVSSYSNDFVCFYRVLPLVFATGPGKIGNRTIGTAAAGGCLLVPFVVYLLFLDCITSLVE